VVWGRFLNNGQTCIAADYVLCHADVVDKFTECAKAALLKFYGPTPKQSPDLSRMVNERHLERVATLLRKSQGRVLCGGLDTLDVKERYLAPTLVDRVGFEDALMSEEIFGPILPIVAVPSIEAAVHYVNEGEKPLALYVFSQNAAVIEDVLARTSSGGAVANDILMHATVPALPFGGVGASGQGGYHGKHSFDLFSHKRSVMVKTQSLEFVNAVRYPPYTEQKLKFISSALFHAPAGRAGFGSAMAKLALAVTGASQTHTTQHDPAFD